MQTTSKILMIRPVNFGFNPETAVNNAFQKAGHDNNIQAKALTEFDLFVQTLRQENMEVIVVEDTPEPYTPDSIFPNNWISFHEDGTIVLYPMFAPNRRLERKEHVINTLQKHFVIKGITDLSGYEKENIFLEGTGSMVLDRINKIAYACLSPRTNENVLNAFCRQYQYTPVLFHATDEKGIPVYHTNVLMCVAGEYAVLCLDSVSNIKERNILTESILHTGKKIIPISFDQMNRFAGNMLQLETITGEKVLVMSSQAYHSLSETQVQDLLVYNRIIHSPINTIEMNGGGSARCMIAAIHL